MAEIRVKLIPEMGDFQAKIREISGAIGSVGSGSAGAGKATANSAKQTSIFDGLGKNMAKLVGIGLIIKALLDALSPLLKMITTMVTIFVFPFMAFVMTLLKPVMILLVKFMLDMMKAFGLTKSPSEAKQGSSVIPGFGTGSGGGGQQRTEIKQNIDAISIDFTTGLKAAFQSLFELLAGVGDYVIPLIAGVVNSLFKAFGIDLIDSLSRGLISLTDKISDGVVTFSTGVSQLFSGKLLEGLSNMIFGIVEILIGIGLWLIETIVTGMGDLGEWINSIIADITGIDLVGGISSIIEGIINTLIPIGGWIYSTLISVLKRGFDMVVTVFNIGKSIYDSMMSVINAAVAKATSLISGVVSEAKKGFDNFVAAGKKTIGISDAIITPSGQVIQTDPADYLIATKNPGSLGGGSVIININNPTVRDDRDIDIIIERFKREMETNMKRAGNYA